MNSNNSSETFQLLLFILKHKKINSLIFGIIFVLSTVVVFFVMAKQYTAEVSILPSAANAAQGLSGKLGSLASLAGVNLGSFSARSQEMYSGLLFSRDLLEKTIFHKYTFTEDEEFKEANLIDFFEIEGDSEEVKIQKTLKILREDAMVVNIDRDNQILYLLVTLKDPAVAAQAANYMVEVLDELVLSEVQKEITEQYSYLNRRIRETGDSLSIAEKELQKLLESTSDPTRPEFQVAQLRARRKVEIQTAIYVEMRKQMELLYLQNFVNLSPIKVLDPAYPPYRKSRPKRLFVLITFLALGGLMQIGANWAVYLYRRGLIKIPTEDLDRERVEN
ncbi:MAG: hypothetical protein HUU32_19605 [Calditrichaceae bacterium]|nr:Wzz/FepE/Etk N-terminal domain-containing protein [Calditrichia bacterium]NUQ43603.1 hypothetical protein [Calditrichaceae bacterium]